MGSKKQQLGRGDDNTQNRKPETPPRSARPESEAAAKYASTRAYDTPRQGAPAPHAFADGGSQGGCGFGVVHSGYSPEGVEAARELDGGTGPGFQVHSRPVAPVTTRSSARAELSNHGSYPNEKQQTPCASAAPSSHIDHDEEKGSTARSQHSTGSADPSSAEMEWEVARATAETLAVSTFFFYA